MFRRRAPFFCAFDLLMLDGEDVRGLPLLERKRRLFDVMPRVESRLRSVGGRSSYRSTGTAIGSSALFLIAAAAAVDARNSMKRRAVSGYRDRAPIPADTTDMRCTAAGNGPTKSMPSIGINSLICWNPISASPLATTVPTR